MTADDLRAWRRVMQLSQRAAAQALGVDFTTIQRMEARGEVDRRTALACAALSAGLEEWAPSAASTPLREMPAPAWQAVARGMQKYGMSSDGRGAALDAGIFLAPFGDDGAAFRLETDLSFSAIEWADGVEVGEFWIVSGELRPVEGRTAFEKFADHAGDKCAARRLAGLRAAAKTGNRTGT